MGSEERLTVKLLGGGPWGFRLVGGAGTGQPLLVNKIRRKSKAQHQLKEGDFILSINAIKCQALTYDEAMNIVDDATDSLTIEVLRSKSGKENVAPQQKQQPRDIGPPIKVQESAARTEATPLNIKENYSMVEHSTKTFGEDQRLPSTSIQQTSQTHEQHTKTTQIEQSQNESHIGKTFFPQTKFTVPKPTEMISSQETQQTTTQQFQQFQQIEQTQQHFEQQSNQTQFYQENFQHPQFQLPQKPPHQPVVQPSPFQHPELPKPQMSQQPVAEPPQQLAPQLQSPPTRRVQFEPQPPPQQAPPLQPQFSPLQFQPQEQAPPPTRHVQFDPQPPQQQAPPLQPQFSPQQFQPEEQAPPPTRHVQFDPQPPQQQASPRQFQPQEQAPPPTRHVQFEPQQQAPPLQPQSSPRQFQPQEQAPPTKHPQFETQAPPQQPQSFQPQAPPQQPQSFQPQAPPQQPQSFQPQAPPQPPQFQPQAPPQQPHSFQPLTQLPRPFVAPEPLLQQTSVLQHPSIAPTFNAKASLISSQLFASPTPFSPSNDMDGQDKVVSFEQTSDDKHFHQLKTEQTHQKTDHSETQTFLREEQSITREGGEDLAPEIDSKPSKPVSSIIQDLEEATRDFNRVADAMSTSNLSSVHKSIDSSSSLYKVSKFESREATSSESHSMWRPTSPIFDQPIAPPSEFKPQASQEVTSANIQQTEPVQKVAPQVPQVLPKPKPRPISAPPMDINIFDHVMQNEMGSTQRSEFTDLKSTSISTSSTSEYYSSSVATNAYQPSPEADEMGSSSLLSRRRKMYTSSSFYEEPGAIYPTVEEQVELCRKIADSLSADTNKKSKGANMFYKRVKRSHKWIHESGLDAYSSDGCTTDTEQDPRTPDISSAPYIRVSKGPPKLKLIMAPREILDMQKLIQAGQLVNEHNVVSPDICRDIVHDLNSPCGRGAALFAKRKQRAEDWIVDDEKVRAKIETRKASMASLEQLSNIFPPPVAPNPRVKLIKSPWEAAMESPIGSCDAAFEELPPVVGNFMAHSIIQAAENKLASTIIPDGYDPSTEYHPPGNRQPDPIYKPVAPVSVDIYRPKAPKGWKGTTQEYVPSQRVEPELAPFAPPASYQTTETPPLSRVPTTTPRPLSFHDFNTLPRSWGKNKSNPPNRTASFRPVLPPSTNF